MRKAAGAMTGEVRAHGRTAGKGRSTAAERPAGAECVVGAGTGALAGLRS